MLSAVSDSSVLIHLGAIGRLQLLPAAFKEVRVPSAVWDEVVTQGRSRPVVELVQSAAHAGWLQVIAPADKTLVRSLCDALHAGEAEAICLALETKPDVLLMDESEGRQVARRLGLQTQGILGVLVQAKADGRIAAIRPLIEELIRSGFRLAPSFTTKFLQQVGEAP